MKWALAIAAAVVLVVAAMSRRLRGTSVTPVMVFMSIGLLVGPLVAGQLNFSPTGEVVRALAEATLTIVLFSDASRIKLRALRRAYSVPLRLLGIGLPLTIGLGAVLAAVMFSRLTFLEAVVLAVLVAPTDSALGQAVIVEPRLPLRIRQALNVESGLNDDICLALLLVALAAVDVETKIAGSGHAYRILLEELGYGVLGGVAAGAVAAAIVAVCYRRKLVTESWLQVIPLAGAGLAYGVANALGGSGFIAAFVAGALFGALVSRESELASRLSEELGELLGGVTFLVFGAVLLGPALEHLSWQIASYAVLSLTVVRMLPVAVAMIGSGARRPTVAFLGWFGPRGLASIVFAVIVVQESHLPAATTILRATYIAIGLSVIVHGVTAAPLAVRYARWYESHSRDRQLAMESVGVEAPRPRGPQAVIQSG